MAANVALRPLLAKREVCELLRASPRTVDRLIADGVLRSVQLVPRGRHRFCADDVERLIGGEAKVW